MFVHFDSLVHVLSLFLLGGYIEFLDFRLFFSDSLEEGLSFLGGDLSSEKFSSSQGLGVWIQFDHHSQVSERILLVNGVLLLFDLVAQMGLDLLRVDNAAQIRVSELSLRKSESDLEFRRLLVSSIELVEFLEGSFCPDNETSQMASWCQLKKIKTTDRAQLNARNVSESSNEGRFCVVDDQWSFSLGVSSVSRLSRTTSKLSRVFDLFNIRKSIDGFEELDSGGGLCNLRDGLV